MRGESERRGLSGGVVTKSPLSREDLYYRLRRVILEVPPLRARREDMPLLVEHIRVEVNTRYGLAIEGFTDEVCSFIQHASWLGNVRELEAVLEEAMILRAEGWLERQDVNLRLSRFRGEPLRAGAVDSSSPPPLMWLQREALRLTAERQEVRRRDFMARCGISREVARRELAGLVKAGLLRRCGAGRGVHYVPDGECSGSAGTRYRG